MRNSPERFADFAARLDAMELEAVEQADFFESPAPRTVPVSRHQWRNSRPAVLDLFAGMGGFSLGFRAAGFQVKAVDRIRWTKPIFRTRRIGRAIRADLSQQCVMEDVAVLIGGPPCRPWSLMNRHRLAVDHPDQPLLGRFFEHIHGLQPEVFLFENVPPVWWDRSYRQGVTALRKEGYSVRSMVIDYSHFGAATARRRLFTVGVRGSLHGSTEFFDRLRRKRHRARTVGQEIGWLRHIPEGEETDHEWSQLRTIGRYTDRYEKGRHGWIRLDPSAPAPSFGNVTKTYVLHPDSAPNSPSPRILSVRELLCIMGFGKSFTFPPGIPISRRYQMLADTISPRFSRACAEVIREMLCGDNLQETLSAPTHGKP